jgi:hypothetical protein
MLVQIIGIFCFSAIALTLFQRRVHYGMLLSHNDVAGFIYAVVGIVYGVLLGFFVLNVWDQYQVSQLGLLREAGHLSDIFNNASGSGMEGKNNVKKCCIAYGNTVVQDEFIEMRNGKMSRAAALKMKELQVSIWELVPISQLDVSLKTDILSELNGLIDERQKRLLMLESGLDLYPRMVLISGALITILFSFFFGTKNRSAHFLMVMLLAGIICLVLVLIDALDLPYSGLIRISNLPFKEFLIHMNSF